MSAADNFNLRDFIRTERARDRNGRIHHFVKYLPENHANQQLVTCVSGGVSVMRADGRLYEKSDCMGDLVSVAETDKLPTDRSTTMPLDFNSLRNANVIRCSEFKDAQGRLSHPGGVADWGITQWTNAMAGECGEACNLAKKVERGDFTIDEARQALGKELADVIIYADLVAARIGVDLGLAVRQKFNEVSERVASSQRL